MSSKLHSILKDSFENYHHQNGTPWPIRKVILRILKCRTESLGGYKWTCSCGNEKIIYRSCRSRSCPQCGAYELKKFIDSKMQKVFPGSHFHLIFTIPEELNKLWLNNTRVMGTILFNSVKETINQFTSDPKYMGAKPGIIMALHTWGQNLSLHPHIHALVTAGGIDSEGKIKYSRDDYLFPAKAAMKYFRFLFLDQVKNNFRDFPDLNTIVDKCYAKDWNVFIKEKYHGGRGVFLYLSRYIRGLPIKDSRIKHYDGKSVTFSYKDYRDKKQKTMRLSIHDFLQRLFLHIPPKNFRTYRESGLYFSDNIEEFKNLSGGEFLPKQSAIKAVLELIKEPIPILQPIYREEICLKCKKPFDKLTILHIKNLKSRDSPRWAA